MGKRWEHFKTITRHKAVVFHECKARQFPKIVKAFEEAGCMEPVSR